MICVTLSSDTAGIIFSYRSNMSNAVKQALLTEARHLLHFDARSASVEKLIKDNFYDWITKPQIIWLTEDKQYHIGVTR